MNKVYDYGNNVDPQEAEGSLRIHKPTILGKVGQIRPHCWGCVNDDKILLWCNYMLNQANKILSKLIFKNRKN